MVLSEPASWSAGPRLVHGQSSSWSRELAPAPSPRHSPFLARAMIRSFGRFTRRSLPKDVLVRRNVLAALTSDAFSSNAPLRRTIGSYVTPAMLDEIANAYRRGRLLLIGTTNLDQGRPVIWNIGKLAASGRPGVLHLVQQILIASAAIPGAFPPEMIDVEVDGRTYQEMHVDGGASAQVFVYPPSLQLQTEARRHGITRVRRLYVIRNARLNPDWEEIQRSTLSIAGRAISSLIQTQGVGDLYRIYVAASRDDIDFNLAYIPETFTMELKQPFDQGYMRGPCSRSATTWDGKDIPGPRFRQVTATSEQDRHSLTVRCN
jgi:hypothetical protein